MMKLLLLLSLVLVIVSVVISYRNGVVSRISSSTRNRNKLMASSVVNSPIDVLNRITKTVQYVIEKPVRAQYALAMATRFTFFLVQGLTVSATLDSPGQSTSTTTTTSNTGLNPQAVIQAIYEALLEDDVKGAVLPQSMETSLTTEEQKQFFAKNFASIISLMKKELNNIENGVYKLPYDLDISYANQWNPALVLNQLNRYVTDRKEVIERRAKRDGREIKKSFISNKYPDYYLQNFHYQTDGWLSQKSAELYDYQVESLFLGSADAMRRQILVPIRSFFNGKDASDIKHLDLASGTGRFASFLLDNYRSLDTTVMDLSPFYLAEAKKLLNKYDNVKYVEGAGEDMPFPSNSFDSITCVYMFHELPAKIRGQVTSEIARVLKPGGKLFFVDSAQAGEVPFSRVLEGFTLIAHEPYYLNYTKQNLTKLFLEHGLKVEEEEVNWVSKCITATKI